MNRDELQSRIRDLITDVTANLTKEIMNLVDEHEHEHVEFVKPIKFLFKFITMKNDIQNDSFRIYATGKTKEDAEKEARLEVYKLSRVWPDEIILLEFKELD